MRKLLKQYFSTITPHDHIFKVAGAVLGFISLQWFGLIFGTIGGTLIDQLTAGLRQKNQLRRFYYNPSGSQSDDRLIDAAGAALAWMQCEKDAAKTEILSAVLQDFFPHTPRHSLETLSEADETDKKGLEKYFGRFASEKQKANLQAMLRACGISMNGYGDNPLLAEANATAADYELLGLKPGASADEVKRIYYKLASQFHPDGSVELSAEQKKMSCEAFKKIKDAYERINR